MTKCFSIIVPCYNEIDNIEPLCEEILLVLKKMKDCKYELIVVDDGSSDGTDKILKKLEKNKLIKFFCNQENLGQSYSILNGINHSQFENIITLDGDGQNDPANIPDLINIFFSDNNYALVSGIRTDRKDGFIKKNTSRIANKVRSMILKDGCPDTGCSLKIFSKNIFLKFPYFDGIHRFLPALFLGFGYTAFYVPVNHRQRKKGISKYGTFDRLFKGIYDLILVKKILIRNKT